MSPVKFSPENKDSLTLYGEVPDPFNDGNVEALIRLYGTGNDVAIALRTIANLATSGGKIRLLHNRTLTPALLNDQIGFILAGSLVDLGGGVLENHQGAAIGFFADENYTATDAGSRIEFNTAPKGSFLRERRLAITSDFAVTPASAVAAGISGEFRCDGNFFYFAVADNSWKRVAIAAW